MLNVTELIGFGAGEDGGLSLSYINRYFGPTTVATSVYAVTTAPDTKMLIIGAHTLMNGHATRTITNITVNGVPATALVSAVTTNEYRSKMAFWVINNVPPGQVVSVAVTHNLTAAYGYVGVSIWSVSLNLVSVGYDSTGSAGFGADPLVATFDVVKDGISLALWDSYSSTPSITYFTNTYWAGISGHQPCIAWIRPPTTVIGQSVSAQDGFGGNDGQTLLLISFASTRFG